MNRKRIFLGATVLMVLAVAAALGAGALVRHAAAGKTFSDLAAVPHRKAGLLLGCSRLLANGQPNLFFAHRMRAAAQLFHAGKVEVIIVSGDNHVAGYDEASDMKHALTTLGIPEARIVCDYAGFRTLDSIARAKAVFGQTEITIISQQFHNERAIYIATHSGIDAIGFNAPDVGAFASFRTRVREQFARVRTILDVALGTRPKFYGPPVKI